MVIDICKELGQNFIDFSYEANSARAFPDARDGLKPGQRACLWEMYNSGYTSNKPPVKSAKISGAVSGNWWPHGDVAIYETFARMSQPWINNVPEVLWHGNNGSQFTGPECASSRYTEAKLSKIVEDGMFANIKKNVVKMIPNYSEDAEWPEVLPAIFPRLLVNGCQGIGSTIANTWLPHSFSEVADIIIKYIETKQIDTKNIYPSFPSGGVIINKDEVHSIYETGKGKVILRGKATIEKDTIVITELPYQVYAQPYVEKITDMAIKEELTGINSITNKSGKNKLRIEIKCDTNAQKVLSQLYNKTDLQKNYNANQWALIGKTPKLLTLKDCIDLYLSHNGSCIKREAEFDYNKALSRQEIVKGLLKALEDIDNIITLIKSSESAVAAREKLKEKYSFTENQAKAIVNMKLGSLAGLEKIELNNEFASLEKEIERCTALIDNEEKRIVELKNRLEALVKKYGDNRKTELIQISTKPEEKEIAEVIPEDVVVVMSQDGNIKRIPAKSFKLQRRNGKGVKSNSAAVLETISTNTIDTLMFFTNKGKMYRTVVDNIPEGTNSAKGQNINSIISLENDEIVIAMTSLYRKTNAKYVVFFTKNGLVKKSYIDEYTTVKRNSGIQAIKLAENDSIANVTFLDKEEVVVITKNGMSIRFDTESINPIGRVSMGVKSIKLTEDDEVLIGLPIHKESDCIAIFLSDGIAKKTKLDEFVCQGRGGKGVKSVSSKNAKVIGATMISDDDNILLIGKPNSICISAKDLPLLSRSGVGNIMIKSSSLLKIVKI